MTPQEMRDQAEAAGDGNVYLSIPEPPNHNGYRVRLFRSHGPYAYVICGARNRLTVYVNAKRLIEFLDRPSGR